jgi:hypothetical protein
MDKTLAKLEGLPSVRWRPAHEWPEHDQQDVALTVGYALYDEAGIFLYWSA